MHYKTPSTLAAVAFYMLFGRISAACGAANSTANDMLTAVHEMTEAQHYTTYILEFPTDEGFAHAANIDLGDYFFYLLQAVQDGVNGIVGNKTVTPGCAQTYTAFQEFAPLFESVAFNMVEIVEAPIFTLTGIDYLTNQFAGLATYLPLFVSLFAEACDNESPGIVATGATVTAANAAALFAYFVESLGLECGVD